MTVAELRLVLAEAEPEATVLLIACDHKYRAVDAAFNIDAAYSTKFRSWSEYYGEAHREPWEDEVHNVVVIQ